MEFLLTQCFCCTCFRKQQKKKPKPSQPKPVNLPPPQVQNTEHLQPLQMANLPDGTVALPHPAAVQQRLLLVPPTVPPMTQQVLAQPTYYQQPAVDYYNGQPVQQVLNFAILYVLFFSHLGVLRCFQHCTGHITIDSFVGRGNQYIQLVSRFCTVNCQQSVSYYQLSHTMPRV